MRASTEGNVYLEAAEAVFTYDLPVPYAIRKFAGEKWIVHVDAVKAFYFDFDKAAFQNGWPWHASTTPSQRREYRTMALCFMAAMVEAGDA